MKLVYLFLIILFTGAPALSQVISFPKDYSIIDSVAGDLDKDGVDELVVAYNTRKGNEGSSESIPRQLVIYKKRNSQWTEWEKSDQVLYGSREGGMMGDPFGEINIEKGILRISQEGGTSWKWVHTDMYRWDSASFRLIGFNSTYGKPCAYWEDVDFNLVTGKLIVTKEYENCENENKEIHQRQNEAFYQKGLHITLQKRRDKQILIISPKYQHQIYVAVKAE